jgi:hypothetical protein
MELDYLGRTRHLAHARTDIPRVGVGGCAVGLSAAPVGPGPSTRARGFLFLDNDMSDRLQWFRLWSDAVDDEKLRLLAFEDRWHFVALLCCKAQGFLDEGGGMMRRKVAVKLGLQVRELEEVGRRLAEVGLIDEETLEPAAWDKRQRPSDRSTERVKAWRENQRAKRNGSETLQQRFETAPETETEKEDSGQKRPRSSKPKHDKETGQNDEGFAKFWSAYPRKQAKAEAAKAWKSQKLAPLADLIVADVTRRRLDDCQWRDPQYIPHPTTYLRQRRWEDEILTAEAAQPQAKPRRMLRDAL